MQGRGPNSKTFEELFQLEFGHFQGKGGRADPNPIFLRNFCHLEIRLRKKVPQTCPKIQEGVKAVWTMSKVKLVFFSRKLPLVKLTNISKVSICGDGVFVSVGRLESKTNIFEGGPFGA